MEENIIYDEELQHWGIKGQKWGRRRYQNKDGSLTPEGRKRYGSLSEAVGAANAVRIKAKRKIQAVRDMKMEEVKKLAAEKRVRDVDNDNISSRKMTADELQRRIEKLSLEKKYQQLLKETEPASATVDAGKATVKKFWNDAIMPAVTTATKEALTNTLKDQVKKRTGASDDALDGLEKTWKRLDLEQKISNAKKTIHENDRKMNGEDDDRMPSMDDRQKIYSNPEFTSAAEKERYKKQGWYDEDRAASYNERNKKK